MDIEIVMRVEEEMDVSTNEDEPKGVNGDADEDNEPTTRRVRRLGIGHYHGLSLHAKSEFGHGTRGSAPTRTRH